MTGYDNRTNKLELFDLDTVDDSIVGDGIDFDKKDIAKNLTLFLYPDDSDDDRKKTQNLPAVFHGKQWCKTYNR